MAGAEATNTIDSQWLDFAPLIILLPMMTFAVILFLGRVFNGNPFWKNKMKEGGLIALPVMGASLVISLLLISEFLGGFNPLKVFDPATVEKIAWVNSWSLGRR